MSTTYLFWDIDGTLLDTARAGIFAWEEAIREVLGDEPDMATMQTAGLTDAQIALRVAAAHGHHDPRRAGDLLHSYAGHLPERLGWRQGRVLPNARENLEALAQRGDVVNMLLTGNVAAGAQAKLRHYDLWDFFGAGGAFSIEGSRPPLHRPPRPRAGGPARRRDTTRRAHGGHRRHPARRVMRQGDRRAHRRGRDGPGVLGRGSACDGTLGSPDTATRAIWVRGPAGARLSASLTAATWYRSGGQNGSVRFVLTDSWAFCRGRLTASWSLSWT